MAFSTRYIDEYRAEIKLDLKDAATLWSNGELDRSIQRAVEDLGRFYPLEAAYEHTIVQAVTSETWTAGASAGTYVALANKPIEPGSETVTDSGGNACTRDTDYYMDYINGKITHISGGEIDNDEASCVISYKKDRVGIDVSAIISNLIRIVHVEYPHDQVPQQKVTFSIYNDFMYIGSQLAGKSQTYLTDKKHIVIYYEKPHTAPLAAAAPSYPAFLDQVICIGAGGYALLIKAIQHEHQAVTDLASLRTELGLTTAIHALADAALDKVATYLETNGTTDNAKDVLANITDDLAELRDKIQTAQGAMATELGLVGTNSLDKVTTGAEAYLDTGDSLINAVNLGADVPNQYANYARARVDIALARIQETLAYGQEAASRIDTLRTYIEEAGGWNRIAEDFIGEAQQRIIELNSYIAEAEHYRMAAETDLVLADRFRAEGQQRLAEFYRILEDKTQYRRRMSSVPVLQPPSTSTQGDTAPRTDRI